jgi:hypothetical protein
VSVGLEYKSVDSTPSDKELEVSRTEMVVLIYILYKDHDKEEFEDIKEVTIIRQ